MTYLYHASWSHEFQLYSSNDATCIDEIQHNFLPSILFLVQSLETSSTHSFLSSSFILSLPPSLPTSPFLPPSPPSLPPFPPSLPPFLPVLTSSLWRQLSEHTLSPFCNDSVCAPPFHSLGGRKGGGKGKRMGGGRGGGITNTKRGTSREVRERVLEAVFPELTSTRVSLFTKCS